MKLNMEIHSVTLSLTEFDNALIVIHKNVKLIINYFWNSTIWFLADTDWMAFIPDYDKDEFELASD